MVEQIYELKNALLEQLGKDAEEKGAGRIDGDMVDMVKDLAEAEKSCWEAEYYRSVTEAMGGQSGYMPQQAGYGYSDRQMGYNRNRDSQGRYTSRRGYSGAMGHTDALEGMRYAIQNAKPEERERMKAEARSILGL